MTQRKILTASLEPGSLEEQVLPIPFFAKFLFAAYREQTKKIDLHFDAPAVAKSGNELRTFRTFVAENIVPADFNYLSSVSEHDVTIHIYERPEHLAE